MKTRNLTLLTFLIFLLTSCMPDSFTKFKEDPPSKTTASGGSTSSGGTTSGGSTSGSTSGGSTTGGGGGEEESDVQYTIANVGFYQSQGDTLVFEVADGTDFSVGEQVNVSNDLFGGGTINGQVGTITAVNIGEGAEDQRILAVRLDGSSIPDYDDNFSADPSTSIYNNDLIAPPIKHVDNGYFIDNCSTGFGTCAVGTYHVTTVASQVAFLVGTSFPLTPIYTNASNKNLHKRIKVTRSGGSISASTVDFNYSFTGTDSLPFGSLGLGFEDSGATDGKTDDGSADNDRLVSPYGPFPLPATSDFSEVPLTVNVELGEDYRGDTLDPEEQGSGQIFIIPAIPGEPVEDVQTFELTYYLKNNQRFAIRVENVSGFAVGETVRACRVTLPSGCDSDNETVTVEGKATVDYIDTTNRVLYLTAQNFDHDGSGATSMRESIFKQGRFIHNGAFVTAQQSTVEARLFKDTDNWTSDGATPEFTLTPVWNTPETTADDPNTAPTNLTVNYAVDNVPASGFSIDPSTGVIRIDQPSIAIDEDITITATDVASGEVLDTFTINLNFLGAPIGKTFADGSVTKLITADVGQTVNEAFTYVTDSNSDYSDGGSLALGSVFIRQNPGDGTPLPSSVSITNTAALQGLRFTPTDFVDSSVTYNIQSFIPAFDASNPFDSVDVRFSSATGVDRVIFPQSAGQALILKVGDTTGFSTATGSNKVSTPSGALGTVTFVDAATNRIFITVDSALSGLAAFKPGDPIDKTSSFVVERTRIIDDGVVFVFDVGTTVFDGPAPAGLIPGLYNNDGTVVTPGTGEEFSFAITPDLPSDLTMNTTNSDGTINGTITKVGSGNLGNLEETTYTIALTNGNGNTLLTNFIFTITESPTLPSIARYQFVRLSGNGNRFYRGTRIQAENGGVTGRVLMTIDTDGNGVTDSLLLEANGYLANGVGIDNTAVFFASEATIEPYQFWYVKDSASFDVSDTVTSVRGDQAIVRAVDSANDRLYVYIQNGNFVTGDVITEDDASVTTVVKSVENRHFVTGVIEVSAADWANFTVGGPITSSTGSGLIIQKHRDLNYTATDTTDDRYYLLVKHTGGTLFSEGQSIDALSTYATGLYTVQSVVGPIVDITLPGNAVPAVSSSSRRVDSAGNPFFEGNMIGNFVRGTNAYQSVGFAVAGTDFANNNVRVAVEDFRKHFKRGASATSHFIDDFSESPSGVGLQATSHNTVSGVSLSNLMMGYVGEEFFLESNVKGEFSAVTLSPETLPAGLSFDSATGRISGTPTQPSNLTTYTLTFRTADGSGTASYQFPLIIYNQFEVAHSTTGASSYVVHREGQGLGTSRCKVISPQVIDDLGDPNYGEAIYGMNDIVCILEGGESDLFTQGVDFNVKSGNGMCEYVRYVPFSFESFLPGNSNREIVIYNAAPADIAQCDPSGTANNYTTFDNQAAAFITTAEVENNQIPQAGRTFGQEYCESGDCGAGSIDPSDFCTYNYNQINSDWPNLDEGTITVNTVTCTAEVDDDTDDGLGGGPDGNPDNVACGCTVTTATIDCGGDASGNIAGAKHSSSLDPTTEASQTTNSFNGLNQVESIDAPQGKSFTNNTYLANFVAHRNYASAPANSCYESNHHMDSYTSAGVLTSNRGSWADPTAGQGGPFERSNIEGSGLYSNYYTYECLDAAANTKARIRILVRDWDREFTPEDYELTSYANRTYTSARTVALTNGSFKGVLNATLQASDNIGLGSVVYIEDGSTAGLQVNEDRRFEVSEYIASDPLSGGSPVLVFKTASTVTAGANTLYVKTKQDDELSNSFGNNYDSRRDFDTFWNTILTDSSLTATLPPLYGTCGANPGTTDPGQTATVAAGGRTVTFSGDVDIAPGTVIVIGGVFRAKVLSVVSSTSVVLANPSPGTFAGAAVQVYRGIPYPFTLPE